MNTDNELMTRLDAAQRRLAEHARAAKPDGLSEPDEGGTERWEAGQVWAHIAEFVPYWNAQLRMVIEGYSGTPVPFGRSKTDPIRTEPIEANRNEPIPEQMARTNAAVSALETYLGGLSAAQWGAVGMHPARGAMGAHQIVETFVVDHLEEHADQLDSLG
jgi:hypothetical protein